MCHILVPEVLPNIDMNVDILLTICKMETDYLFF